MASVGLTVQTSQSLPMSGLRRLRLHVFTHLPATFSTCLAHFANVQAAEVIHGREAPFFPFCTLLHYSAVSWACDLPLCCLGNCCPIPTSSIRQMMNNRVSFISSLWPNRRPNRTWKWQQLLGWMPLTCWSCHAEDQGQIQQL